MNGFSSERYRWSIDPTSSRWIADVTYENLDVTVYEANIFFTKKDDVRFDGLMFEDMISMVSRTDIAQRI